jgi:hypothetical protein
MANSKNKGLSVNGQKPNLPERLFWDFEFDKIDWKRNYRTIIARVIERGNKAEWEEMISFYGHSNVVHALKVEIKYLPDYIIDKVCGYFNLKKEELACYTHKQSRQGHWL